MKKIALLCLCVIAAVCFAEPSAGTDEDASDASFGFGGQSDTTSAFSFSLGGRIASGMTFLFGDFVQPGNMRLGSLAYASFYAAASAPLSAARFEVELNDKTLPVLFGQPDTVFPDVPQLPPWISEAFVQGFFGPVTVGGGIKKITWGRADTMSVLDVINPRDMRDPTQTDPEKNKIARPLVHAAFFLPKQVKIEALFVPVFEGNTFNYSGRWISLDAKAIEAKTSAAVFEQKPDTASVRYAQYGTRLTASVGSHDMGFQYYYGFLPMPAVDAERKELRYTPFHQLGCDYAFGVGAFTGRAEFAANITTDRTGTRPDIHNPFLAWSLGMDYSFPLGFTAGVEAAETIRLFNDRASVLQSDTEAGRKPTHTRIALTLSQTTLRGALTWKLTGLACVEDKNFELRPSITFLYGTVELNMALGFFFGDPDGLRGPYKNNSYIQLGLGYSF